MRLPGLHALRRCLAAGLALSIGIAAGPQATALRASEIRLPDIGDPSDSLMTRTTEERLGDAFMRSIRAKHPVVDDPLMKEYISSLGNRLATASNARQGFDFFLIDEPVVNAFAGPDGKIGVYTGLVLSTESESELASVMAHEIAHITQKHLRRTFDAYSRMSVPAGAALLAAVVAGLSGAPTDVTSAAMAGVQAALVQQQINFTRANEEEADRVGMSILAEAGFDPRAMPVFFERLAKRNRSYAGEVPEFLRTHPVTVSRIADSLGRAEDYPYRQYPDSLDYHLLRSMLRVRRFDDPNEATKFFRDSIEEGRYRNEAAQRFGYVLALMEAERYDQARAQMDRLLETHPDPLAFTVIDARLYKKNGDPQRALERLARALEVQPGNYALTRYYAQDLLEAGKPERAQKILAAAVERRPEDASLRQLLSRAAGAAGDPTAGHQHLAEYYYLRGDYEAAIRQLEIGLRDRSAEYFQSAQMAARLKQLRSEWKEVQETDKKIQ